MLRAQAYPDVDFVEGDGLQDGELAALHVEREVVDGRVVEGQQDGVERNARHVHLNRQRHLLKFPCNPGNFNQFKVGGAVAEWSIALLLREK